MAAGGRRKGAGDRVLESRHVIGLFMLMLLFSGIFFTLGYVMGRNQYDGQVRAAGNPRESSEIAIRAKVKSEPTKAPKNTNEGAESQPDASAPPASDWGFYNAGKAAPPDDTLKPLPPAPKTMVAVAKGNAPSKASNVSTKVSAQPVIPGGSYTLQVAALRKESEAFSLASELRKKKFPAFVVSPQADKYFRVQVGPYADQKSADAARKGLEGAGFKAIVKH
jgi:cell division septation protein DedD